MKNITWLLLLVFVFNSCEDHEVHQFALQAEINNRLYTSSEANVIKEENDTYTITGSTRLETLTIKMNRLEEGNYNMGPGRSSNATFEDHDGNIFSTRNGGSGTITLSEVNLVNNTISGTFNFNAVMEGIDTIYVSKGFLYNVPMEATIPADPNMAGTFSAKVNGQNFNPMVVTALKLGTTIAVTGNNASSSIVITVPSNVEPGEYPIDNEEFIAVVMNLEGSQEATSGTIKITTHNRSNSKLKATFSFSTATNEVTEGQFDVIYQ